MKIVIAFLFIFEIILCKQWNFLKRVDRQLNPALLKAKLEVPVAFTSLTPQLNNPNIQVVSYNNIMYGNNSDLKPIVDKKNNKYEIKI